MTRDDDKYKRKRFEKVRQDHKQTKRPEGILTGPGYNGQVQGPRTNAQNIMRTIYETSKNKMDPLEAIERVREHARANPRLVDHAYKINDPTRVLDYTSKDSAEMQLMSLFAKCKFCGMKICQCHKQLRPEEYEKKS